MKQLQIFASIVTIALFTAFSVNAAPKVIIWEDLASSNKSAKEFDFSKPMNPKGMPSLEDFDGSQEDLNLYVEYIESMRQMQPEGGEMLATNLNGKNVKIAGYVTPITFDGDQVVDFLLVPYLGACMHVPPPPANQIVYVENAKGLTASAIYDPIWLTGKLTITPIATVVANVGYTISNAKIEPYVE